MPNADTFCEAATNSSNSEGRSARGAWNGCYPNTVMISNWRASLVPAAAVIPAPRAYTNIAAVKALVVSHWAAGLSGASVCRLPPLVDQGMAVCSGTQPQAVCPCSRMSDGVSAPARSPLHWRPRRFMQLRLVSLGNRAPGSLWPLGKPYQPESTISATLENSMCSKRPEIYLIG